MGEAHIVLEDGTRRNAACIGGMLSMMNGVCRVLATTWEWEEDIDAERAEAAKHRAEQALANGGLTDKEYRIAEDVYKRQEYTVGACMSWPRRSISKRKSFPR